MYYDYSSAKFIQDVVRLGNLVYPYGMYTIILVLGLISNLSRITTYIPPSYLMGGVGIALSYALGIQRQP